MKCNPLVLGLKMTLLAFVVSEANPSPRLSLPDLPTFAAWSAYLEKALQEEAYRRDSVGIRDAQIEVYAVNDSVVALQVSHLHRILDSMNLQFRVRDAVSMHSGVARGKTFQFDHGLKPQAYFDLRDRLLQWRKTNPAAPIRVQVQETPYEPRTGIDSALQFVEQLAAMPIKDKAALENYVSRQVLPQLRPIENLRYAQTGLSVTLQIGRLLNETEIQAEKTKTNRIQLSNRFNFFNRDLPFMQRMGHFEIMAWSALFLGLINTLVILFFLFRRWRSRRIS